MERPIAYKGTRYTIAFAVDASGCSPGNEFFETLALSDKAKLMRLFQRLADYGEIRNSEKFRKLKGQLFEFKTEAMKTRTQFERLMESPEFRKLYAIEGLVTEAGELIARLMEEQKVSRAELARRLGRSRAYVTQMLRGTTNLTLRTLAEVAYALGAEVKLKAVPLEHEQRVAAWAEVSQPVWKVTEIRSRRSLEEGARTRPEAAAAPFAYAA